MPDFEKATHAHIRILHLEDNADDAEAFARFMENAEPPYQIVHVSARDAYEEALRTQDFDIVISNYEIPGFDGIQALQCVQEMKPDTPFILLSGKAGEEIAVDCVKAGASDYILKERMQRMPIAIYRALRDAEHEKRRRQTEMALALSEERFRRIAEQSLAAIAVIEEGRVNYANEYCLQLIGLPLSEIQGEIIPSLMRFIAEEHRARVLQLLEEIFQGESHAPEHVVLKVINSRDEAVWLQASLVRFALRGRDALVIVAVDVTRLKTAEMENAIWATAVRHIAEGIEITDPNGVIEFVNPAAEGYSGYTASELIGCKTSIYKSGEHDAEFYRKLWTQMKQGKAWSGRFINRRKDGRLYQVETTISPIVEDGRVVRFVAVKRDTTQQMALESQLRQAQKMEAVGSLAGGIAHDFNNILTAMMGYTELALGEAEPESALDRDLNRVLEAGSRAKNLIRQLLTFSRQSERVEIVFDLRSVFKETARFLKAALPSHIEVRLHYPEEPMSVRGDATQLHQLLVNLCANARDAISDNIGHVDLRLALIDAGDGIQQLGLEPGRYVLLSVADDGCGMSPETHARAFDPFYTTKDPEHGTGMGLAIAHGVVKAHNGIINCYSELGVGTEFKVYLPYVADSEIDCVEPEVTVPTGTEHILIVDDEAWLVEYFTRVLKPLGYSITGTTQSVEAWQLYERDPTAYDLIITDQTMPKLTGRQLVKLVKSVRPNQPVIVLSGFSDHLTSTLAQDSCAEAYLSKPIDRIELSQRVRAVLDAATNGTQP
jgi:PAS domain S-box-containing protein